MVLPFSPWPALPARRWSSGEELDRERGELLVVLEDAAVT
jgi:hypothetical protein